MEGQNTQKEPIVQISFDVPDQQELREANDREKKQGRGAERRGARERERESERAHHRDKVSDPSRFRDPCTHTHSHAKHTYTHTHAR